VPILERHNRVLCGALVVVLAAGTAAAAPGPAETARSAPAAAVDPRASARALSQLMAWLEAEPGSRPGLVGQTFARTPLTRDDAAAARDALWRDAAAEIRRSRAEEHAARRITIGDFTLRYGTVVLGGEPAGGRDLFIAMHGGGSGPASANDEQWRNQLALATGYEPQHALWVAPRAPTDDWNMWFKDHVDGLFDRLITDMIVFEGVDPDRVYLEGYSAGGDGVYGLCPRTADRWAGAMMSAGHPNGVSLANLRNVAFALHAGGLDSAYDRNTVTAEYIEKLRALHAADPGGYVFQGMVHPGLPHWMGLADAVSIPFLQSHTRNPVPTRVVWEQHDVPHTRMYWLALPAAEARKGARVVASYDGQVVTIEDAEQVPSVRIRLRDDMLDLDRPVRVERDGRVLFAGRVPRTVESLWRTLQERQDPALLFSAELTVEP